MRKTAAASTTIVAVLGAILAAASPAAAESVSFADQSNYALSGSSYGFSGAPTAFAAGDATNDGIPDLVFVSSSSKAVLEFAGQGNGKFSPKTATSPIAGASGSPTAVAIGTFRGRSDAAIGFSSANQLLGGISGGMPNNLVSLAGGPYAMATGDFDEDGLTDVAMPYPGTAQLQIVLQTGDGWQTTRPGSSDANTVPAPAGAYGGLPLDPVTNARSRSSAAASCSNLPVPTSHNVTAPSPTHIAVGDVDGDGHEDLYVSADYGSGGTSDWIAYGDGNGCFPRAATAPGDSRFAQLHDVTGDGRVELLTSQYGCSSFSDSPPDTCNTSVQVFRAVNKDGAVTFGDPYINAYANNVDYPQQWALADFNGDGHPDIFAAGYRHVTFGTSGFGSVQLNIAQGSQWGYWAKQQQIMSDSSHADGPFQAAVADFNLDGYPDAATLNLDSKTVSVMLNTTAANAVVVGDATAAPRRGVPVARAAGEHVSAARRARRALTVRIRCRRGVRARACRGTLRVHRLAPGTSGAPERRRGARVAQVRYRLKPGTHVVRVPLRAGLRRALAGRKVTVSTRTHQPHGRRATRSVRVLRIAR